MTKATMTKAERRRERDRERQAQEHDALLLWLDRIDMSLDHLLDEIERWQPGPLGGSDNPLDTMGVGAPIPTPFRCPPKDGSKLSDAEHLLAFRGVQHLVCVRGWQRARHQPQAAPQLNLF